MPIYVPPLTYQQVAVAAARCLTENRWNGSIPVSIEDIVDVGYRLDLVPTPNLEAEFSTVAFITHDLKEIRVDDFVFRRQPYRLRFSLAHELGHLGRRNAPSSFCLSSVIRRANGYSKKRDRRNFRVGRQEHRRPENPRRASELGSFRHEPVRRRSNRRGLAGT